MGLGGFAQGFLDLVADLHGTREKAHQRTSPIGPKLRPKVPPEVVLNICQQAEHRLVKSILCAHQRAEWNKSQPLV